MPTELVVITISFALVSFGLLALVTRIFFFSGMSLPKIFTQRAGQPQADAPAFRPAYANGPDGAAPSRAFMVSEAVAQTMRREERSSEQRRLIGQASASRERGASTTTSGARITEPLGSAFRGSEARQFRRTSTAADKRDRKA
jgi:hypothetical protein